MITLQRTDSKKCLVAGKYSQYRLIGDHHGAPDLCKTWKNRLQCIACKLKYPGPYGSNRKCDVSPALLEDCSAMWCSCIVESSDQSWQPVRRDMRDINTKSALESLASASYEGKIMKTFASCPEIDTVPVKSGNRTNWRQATIEIRPQQYEEHAMSTTSW